MEVLGGRTGSLEWRLVWNFSEPPKAGHPPSAFAHAMGGRECPQGRPATDPESLY
jgi:hypothetical protein